MTSPNIKKRHRKRISLMYGIDKAEKFGFTDDINHDGLFIRTAVTIRPGGKIVIEINHLQELIAITGEVKWAKKVPQNVLHKLKGGMGVQITSFQAGEDFYHALCNELTAQRGG